MERERYPEIWETIEEKLDKVCEENANQELILIGGYNRAELAFGRHQGVAILLDEYLEGTYDDLDIDRDADYSDQYEQMKAEIQRGCRFGDYQEIVAFSTRLRELREAMGEIESPGCLVGCSEYCNLTRVRINGRKSDLGQKITRELESLRALGGYLEELAELEDTWH